MPQNPLRSTYGLASAARSCSTAAGRSRIVTRFGAISSVFSSAVITKFSALAQSARNLVTSSRVTLTMLITSEPRRTSVREARFVLTHPRAGGGR